MKLYVTLALLNLLVFVTLGPVGIITAALSVYFVRNMIKRGEKTVRAYAYLNAINSGMSVSDANDFARQLNSNQIDQMLPSALAMAKLGFSGSQMSLINKALSEGMEGGSQMDSLWAKEKMSLLNSNKERMFNAKESFNAFCKVTQQEFFKHTNSNDFVLDDEDRMFFIRYLVEANVAAMEQFEVNKKLADDLNVQLVAEAGRVNEDAARGMLAGFNIPSLHDPVTNEPLDEYKGAGGRAYQEWLGGGDASAVVNAESLWRKCYQLHNVRKQLASIGFAAAS